MKRYFYIALASFLVASCSPGAKVAAPPNPPTSLQALSRPNICLQYLEEKDPATWNEETESYPDNEAWMECMGVGPNG